MKFLFVLSVFWLMSSPLYAQPALSSKGRIKSIVEYIYNIRDKITSKHSRKWPMRFESHYDTAGRVIWETYRDHEKNAPETTRYTYNKDGRLLKRSRNTNVTANYSYQRDEQGRLIVRDQTVKDNAVVEIIDEKAKVDTQYILDRSGAFILKRAYNYNRDKTVARITEMDKTGIRETTIETYDEQHRRIDQIAFNSDGSRKSHETVKYDKQGFVRIDSNQMYIDGPPAKVIGDKLTRFTYKYPKLDKYENPLITAFLYGDKYVIVGVTKYKYY